ncbi:MAG: hypothetical protein HYU46_11975 [Deltaproteobacteria bacterium]|nr:hypothetical protein [Deltaproteobacteria bacterium]MBI2229799.1 hypothetical protein [Deltaproteobacteria bacterium]MBI2363980.1 hypothetical protein [Deltaproteobacteria bacterium]MBI3064291.1 hypothetical protein [Deltaproteobacteria bacterium]
MLILFYLGIPTIYTGDALNRLTQVLDPLLGRLNTATSWFENEPHADTQAGEHVDERVSAEEGDPAPEQDWRQASICGFYSLGRAR